MVALFLFYKTTFYIQTQKKTLLLDPDTKFSTHEIGTKTQKFNLYNKDLFFYWLHKAI